MLKPAICYKEEIEKALSNYFYSDDMLYYCGCIDSFLMEISKSAVNGKYQLAVVDDKDGHLIGYIGYTIDYYSSCVYNFGVFSFERGNVIMGKELYQLFENLIAKYHRLEFRAISGNPAIRGYDRFLEKHSDVGKKYVLTDVFKDTDGNYHNDYIYEFVNS